MKFELEGYNINNLLKTLYYKRVVLYDVIRDGNKKVSFVIQDKDVKKVKRYIANFKKKEKPSFFKNIPKFLFVNISILIAVFVGIIYGIFMSAYTWQINIYGTKDLTTAEIIKVLEENNVKKGKINLQSSEEIETILLNNYDRIAQVSVIKKGTAIIINLSEKLVYTEENFEPIRARYCGIITDVKVVTGTINVKIGDFVNIGDELVLPFNLDTNGNKVGVKPMAEITANIYIIEQSSIKRVERSLIRTGRTINEYQYKLFNLNIFSGKNKNSFALFEIVSYNENVSKLIPLSRDVKVYYELTEKEVVHDFEQEKEELISKSQIKAREKLSPNTKNIIEDTEITIANDTMFATTTIIYEGVIND